MVEDPNDQIITVRPLQATTSTSSKTGALAIASVASLTAVWFVVSWAIMDSPIVDALGEALGGMTFVLLIVSVVGVLRKAR